MMTASLIPSLQKEVAREMDALLTPYLERGTPSLLQEAMRYSMQGGGKYIRPLLVMAAGQLVDAHTRDLIVPALAVELIHTYSLIHDDLPCMDDAALRRGRPSCHVVYGEAMAVLAGDALQTLAFEVLTSHEMQDVTPEARLQMIAILAEASGAGGMALGQALDMTASPKESEEGEAIAACIILNAHKTGAVLSAALQMGYCAGGGISSRASIDPRVAQMGGALGLAFQIQDDLLDIESHSEKLGKPSNHDVAKHKMTFPMIVGVEEATRKKDAFFAHVLDTLETFGEKGQLLRELVHYVWQREA